MELTRLWWNCGIRHCEGRTRKEVNFGIVLMGDVWSVVARGRIFQTRVSSPNGGEEWRLPSTDRDKSLSRRKESGFRVDTVYTLRGRNSGGTIASSTTRGVCSGKYTFVWGHVSYIRNHLRASRCLYESDVFAVCPWISLISAVVTVSGSSIPIWSFYSTSTCNGAVGIAMMYAVTRNYDKFQSKL